MAGWHATRRSSIRRSYASKTMANLLSPHVTRSLPEILDGIAMQNNHPGTLMLSFLSRSSFCINAPKRIRLDETSILAASLKGHRISFRKGSRFEDRSRLHFGTEAQTIPLREQEMLHFPGARVQYTNKLKFIPEAPNEPVPCYRLMDDNGQQIDASQILEVDQELGLKIYEKMVTLQVMDTIFYEAQRQGRISFYVTTVGEEAINIASAAALSNTDIVFPQYREPGVLLWRGFTLQQFSNQCFGNEDDCGKGRQMPAHYGSRELNYLTVSSPIATQLPQAVGAAYSLKMNNEPACVVTYFGDGGSSEGDFHAAMNFACVFEVPILFICRNNGWAISTPASEQYKSDGVVVKGQAYGMCSLRVDGNDALAVYAAVNTARKMAVEQCRPVLIEMLTYRAGHHSTSDDSSKYRKIEEIEHWRVKRDPVLRFRKWLEDNSWWSLEADKNFRAEARAEVLSALQKAERRKKPSLAELFTDVYDSSQHLKEQERYTHDIVNKYPTDYPSDFPPLQ